MPISEEILASLSDIQAHLPEQVVIADEDNTKLIQISVARIVRGYLGRVVDPVTLATWNEPASTPEIIREIAGRLIAAQLFFNRTAQSTTEIPERSFAQVKYDEAIRMLESIVGGSTLIAGIIVGDEGTVDTLDFFPIDDTDRAFKLSMEL